MADKAVVNIRSEVARKVPAERRYAALVLYLFHRMSAKDVAEIIGVSTHTLYKWARALTPDERAVIEDKGEEHVQEIKESMKEIVTVKLGQLHSKAMEGAKLLAETVIKMIKSGEFTSAQIVDLTKNMPIAVGIYVDKFLVAGGWMSKVGGLHVSTNIRLSFAGQKFDSPQRVPAVVIEEPTAPAAALPAPAQEVEP